MNEANQERTMANGTKCPQCGVSLPAGALEGLCPACLLKQGVADTATQPGGTPFQPPSVEEVARLFPHLEVLGFIGKGGMGAVYKARQPELDRLVALKILPARSASGPAFAERFNREARALAKLNHPNIVSVHEFGQANGLSFFIMEFVDGLNLRQLERTGKLTPREALQIVPQICEALQFAHDEGIVHRDIKPENILLDKKGRVKIADFGIAKIMGREPRGTITEPEGTLGTPHYMAPEQAEKPQTVDHRADIFSLGVVFYEMLTGELPMGKFAPPSRKVQVDVRLDEVVLHALEKEPNLRYQQAVEVKTDVETITGAALAARRGAPAARPKAMAGWKAGAIVAAAMLVLFVALLLYQRARNSRRQEESARAQQAEVAGKLAPGSTLRSDPAAEIYGSLTNVTVNAVSAAPNEAAVAPGTNATMRVLSDLDAKITRLSRQGTTAAEAVQILGEPARYGLGNEIFNKTNLPDSYGLWYPQGGLEVQIQMGKVVQLRSLKPGPGFTYRGLHLGSSLDEVLREVGPPSKTVVGETLPWTLTPRLPNNSTPGVLYLDVNGEKGFGYYRRPDQNVEFFLGNLKGKYNVIALLLDVAP